MKRIEQKDLRALYAPMPEATAVKLEGLLSALPEAEEEPIVKKKISFALALAAVLVLLAVGAVATAMNWNVLTFLYGEEQPQMDAMMVQVAQTGTADGVTLEIGTAMTDGRSIAFDWTLTVEDDTLPVYLQMDNVTVAGSENIWLDTLGGLNRVWLMQGETTRHNGELICLGDKWQPGEKIAVELTLGVYKPLGEVVIFTSTADRAKAEELAAQGVWTVVPETEMISHRQQNQVQPLWRYDSLTEPELADYERSEIKLSFMVTVPEVTWEQLPTDKEAYEIMPGVSFRVAEAYRTPLNIYASIDIAVAGEENQLGAIEKWKNLFFGFERAEGHVTRSRALTADAGWNAYYNEDGVYHKVVTVCTGAYNGTELAQGDDLYLVCSMGEGTENDNVQALVKQGRYKLHAVE